MKKKGKRSGRNKTRTGNLRCNPEIVFREEGKEALLFNPGSGSIKVLNQTGKVIWKLINGKRTQRQIEDKLVDKFSDVKRKQISEDLANFLNSLEKFGYIGKEI